MTSNSIRILTFNAGLFDLRLAGYSVLKPAAFIAERLRALPGCLAGVEADVIALQEVYEEAHVSYVTSLLRDSFPFTATPSPPAIRIGSGLLLLSKIPVRAWGYVPFDEPGPLDERMVVQRGILHAEISLGGTDSLVIANLHPTSGGFLHAQDAPVVLRMRERQIGQALALAQRYTGAAVTLVLGDFNAGPEIAPTNYTYLLKQGFVDAYGTVCERRRERPSVTWDAANALNAKGTHATSVSQRIDHVYVFAPQLDRVEIVDARVVLNEIVVPVGRADQVVTVSDHYGLAVTLRLRSGAD